MAKRGDVLKQVEYGKAAALMQIAYDDNRKATKTAQLLEIFDLVTGDGKARLGEVSLEDLSEYYVVLKHTREYEQAVVIASTIINRLLDALT